MFNINQDDKNLGNGVNRFEDEMMRLWLNFLKRLSGMNFDPLPDDQCLAVRDRIAACSIQQYSNTDTINNHFFVYIYDLRVCIGIFQAGRKCPSTDSETDMRYLFPTNWKPFSKGMCSFSGHSL